MPKRQQGKNQLSTYKLSISMSPVLYHQLEDFALSQGLTKSSIIGVALSDFFNTRQWASQAGERLIETFKKDPELFSKIVDQVSKS